MRVQGARRVAGAVIQVRLVIQADFAAVNGHPVGVQGNDGAAKGEGDMRLGHLNAARADGQGEVVAGRIELGALAGFARGGFDLYLVGFGAAQPADGFGEAALFNAGLFIPGFYR
ncbi:hypothetical protein, partial [Photorhabdus bodei]